MKVTALDGREYRELGYEIRPIKRENPEDRVTYPELTILNLPFGSQISGAKSQNDWSKFGTPDDIIRIYALVPSKPPGSHLTDTFGTRKYAIYVFPTGGIIKLPQDAEKLTIVKENAGEFIWHIYISLNML